MTGPTWEIRLLGRFAVLDDGVEVPSSRFVGRLSRRLLRMLAVRRGEHVSKDALADALWRDRLPADPDGNLEVLVSRIRRGFVDPSVISTGPGGYTLPRDARVVVDVEELVASAERARAELDAGRADEALRLALAAVERWHGEPLPEDAYEEWAQAPRSIFATTYLEALETGAAAALEVGVSADAVALAERAVIREPLRESATLLMVRALVSTGDRARALAQLASLRTRLADELGLDPSPAFDRVQVDVLRGGEAPTAPPPVRVAAAKPERLPFVGREAELRGVTARALTVVTGVSGAGKTRFLEEAIGRMELPSMTARAYQPERDEPWALVRSIVEEALTLDVLAPASVPELPLLALAEVLPGLVDAPDPSRRVDAQSRRALATEAVVRLLGLVATSPTVLAIDDLQWADATSVHVLDVVAARVHGLRLLFAMREDDPATSPEVNELLRTVRSNPDAAVVELPPLATVDLEPIVDRPLADEMARRAELLPQSVTEILRSLAEEGVVRPGADGRWRWGGELAELGALVRAATRRTIGDRVRRLPPDRRDALRVVAAIGREIPTGTVAAVLGVGADETLEAVESLARAGLVAAGELGWAVRHDSVAIEVLDALETHEETRLHGDVARVLSAEGADASDVARHLEAAGHGREATGAFADAADSALRRFANVEASALATDGLDLAPAEGTAELRGRLLATRGEARMRSGDLAGARDDLREAVRTLPRGGPRAEVLSRIAMLESGSEDYQRANELIELALAEAGDDRLRRARALAVGAIVELNLGRLDRSERRSEEALALFRAEGDAEGAAGILDGRAMAAFLGGRIVEAAEGFDRVARLFLDAGELLRVGTPRSTRGHALVFMARPEEGLADVEESLELSRSLGHPEGEAYALWHRAEALAGSDRADDAIASASDALAIAERISHREWIAASLRGLGIAHEAAGDHAQAALVHRRGLQASHGMPLFTAWAAARLASSLIADARPEDAAAFVEMALGTGTPLSAYEARLAQVELAAARGDEGTPAYAGEAARLAEEGGHLVSLARLRELSA